MTPTATQPKRRCTRCGSTGVCASVSLDLAGERVEVRLCGDCVDSFGRWIDTQSVRQREASRP